MYTCFSRFYIYLGSSESLLLSVCTSITFGHYTVRDPKKDLYLCIYSVPTTSGSSQVPVTYRETSLGVFILSFFRMPPIFSRTFSRDTRRHSVKSLQRRGTSKYRVVAHTDPSRPFRCQLDGLLNTVVLVRPLFVLLNLEDTLECSQHNIPRTLFHSII